MAALRNISMYLPQKLLRADMSVKKLYFTETLRFLNYSSIPYKNQPDPRPSFFSKEVQALLKCLTRVDLNVVFKKRKLGEKIEDPIYKFMTDEELEQAKNEALKTADDLLQMPPAVPAYVPTTNIFSKDPALQGFDTSNFVFADITFGLKDAERLITVRDTDGTLKEAGLEIRQRITQTYFPKPCRTIKPPRVFSEPYFENVLNKHEYKFILDLACLQFEPFDPEYQRIVSITYQHLNDHNEFSKLRSTRHFGSLCFFLVWNKNIDNLMLELIETMYIEEVHSLLRLYSKINNVTFEDGEDLKNVEDYIKKCSNKKGILELALQAYKDIAKRKEERESNIRLAHGIS